MVRWLTPRLESGQTQRLLMRSALAAGQPFQMHVAKSSAISPVFHITADPVLPNFALGTGRPLKVRMLVTPSIVVCDGRTVRDR